MDAPAQPEQLDLTLQLPLDMYHQLIHTLSQALPLVSAAPEDLVRRENAAIAQVAALLPANADEANLAAQVVAAEAEAVHLLGTARQYPQDSAFALRCSALAANMMRQARGARSLLLRVQAVREKREADAAAADRAAWVEHCAIGLMAQALGRDALAPMAEPPAPAPEPVPDAEPQPDPIAEAEHYAVIYPRRAALIRRLGRVPDKCSFGPPEDYVVRALVTGRTPALLALDEQMAGAPPG